MIYFAGYKKGEDLFKRDEIEAATDQVIWSTDTGAEIAPRRPQDAHFRGNIVQAMVAYAKGELGEQRVPLSDVTRIIAIGSDRMMAAVKAARFACARAAPAQGPRGDRQHQLADAVHDEGGLRAVPAEAHRPGDGTEEFIFSCFNQDQEMDRVDFPNLNARLRQNTVQEKLSTLWLDHLLESVEIEHV